MSYVYTVLQACPANTTIEVIFDGDKVWRGIWLGFQDDCTRPNIIGLSNVLARICIPFDTDSRVFTEWHLSLADQHFLIDSIDTHPED